VKFGVKESTHRCNNVVPVGRKRQNRPLSNLNSNTLVLRMLPVIRPIIGGFRARCFHGAQVCCRLQVGPIYILIDSPVQVLSEARVGDAGGVVAEHVNSRVDDADSYHLPVRRQN